MASRRLVGVRITRLLLVAAATALPTATVAAEGPRVLWYATHGAVADRNQSLKLGDSSHVLLLKSGWACTIGSTSKQMPSYEARTTTCGKGSETFEFSVQCERRRLKDHTQIRFRQSGGNISDFIDVGCELADSPN